MSSPPTPADHEACVRFVRQVLGCGCPDEVVARTVVDVGEEGERGLDVGGRLLVRVLAPGDEAELIDALPDSVVRLRRERDRRGFNRLRLVVRAAPWVEADVLQEAFSGIAGADDEVYLHVVSEDSLPAVLMPPGGHESP